MKKPLIISLTVAAITIIAVGTYFIIQSHKKTTDVVPDPIVTEPIQQPITFADGQQCYTYSHEATKEEPVTSTEFINMTITGTKVTGTKYGTQSGPELSNGWEGILTGSLADDTITVAFAYTVEGSQNTEQEIYKPSLTGIDKLQYPLIDKYKDGLFPDTSKEHHLLHYARVTCKGVN